MTTTITTTIVWALGVIGGAAIYSDHGSKWDIAATIAIGGTGAILVRHLLDRLANRQHNRQL